jgi:hypothetical protein
MMIRLADGDFNIVAELSAVSGRINPDQVRYLIIDPVPGGSWRNRITLTCQTAGYP